MRERVISVLAFSSSDRVAEISAFLERAARRGKVHPRDWKDRQGEFRSLTVHEDGTCLLRRLSAAAVVRRMKCYGETGNRQVEEKERNSHG